MNGDLYAAIKNIKNNRTLGGVDEASIKAGVVMRLINCLGWNPFDIDEVTPEYSIGSKRVDYSLRLAGINKCFIEIKRLTESLEKHQEQLLGYAFQEGVKLGVLTNGGTWWLYLPLHEGNWEQRRFYSVDLFQQEPDDVAEKLDRFLSKKNIMSGEAIKAAEKIFKGQQKNNILKESIPKAWHKIITDPDDLLVELIIETTEKLSGFHPDIHDIEEFLVKVPGVENVHNTVESKTEKITRVPTTITNENPDNYINKKPQYFIFLEEKYFPKSWQEILMTVSNELYIKHSESFEKCLSLRGTKMAYFSKDPNELSYPKQIANSEFYAEVKLNSNSIINRCRDLMSLFGYTDEQLKINAK